jgi:CRP-like cAMP-binding protein
VITRATNPEAQRLAAARRTALQYSISQAPIFAGLPEEDLRRLSSYCIIRALHRGEYLFRRGDPVEGFYVVRLGMINVHQIISDGREQIIHLLRPGESFAERAVISESGYPANARANENSEVILIPIAPFKLHQKDRPDLAWRMLASMSHHLRSLVATLEGLRYNDVETRLLHWLLQRCPDPESKKPFEIVLGMSKSDLASELTARRETLSRTFRKLKDLSYLVPKSNSVVIVNPSALSRLFAEKSISLTSKGFL